jgi:hypothetical protein
MSSSSTASQSKMTYIKTFLTSIEDLKEEYSKDSAAFIKRYKKYDVFVGSPESTEFVIEKIMFKNQ